MTLNASEIAQLISGTLHGNAKAAVQDVSSLTHSQPQTLSFLSDPRNLKDLISAQASIILLPETCDLSKIVCSAEAYITVKDPFAAFMELVPHFRKVPSQPGPKVSPQANIDPTAILGEGVSVGPNAVIGAGCRIGNDCVIHAGVSLGEGVILGEAVILYPNVVIYAGCELANRVAIHANSVIGADGFGYRFHGGQFHKLPHYGRVLIQEDVEIGACTTIDRGMIDDTVIGQGTKIDNQVMIGHNCQIGEHNIIVSQVGLAGSVKTGNYCRFGGQVGIADHITIGNNSSLVARSGVFRDIGDNETMGGTPAAPMEEQKRIYMAQIKAPELRQQVRKIQKQVDQLAQKMEAAQSTTQPATLSVPSSDAKSTTLKAA